MNRQFFPNHSSFVDRTVYDFENVFKRLFYSAIKIQELTCVRVIRPGSHLLLDPVGIKL